MSIPLQYGHAAELLVHENHDKTSDQSKSLNQHIHVVRYKTVCKENILH